jgi:hypothetical protein
VYQPLLLLGPACNTLRDVLIQISKYDTDQFDATFCSPFKVCLQVPPTGDGHPFVALLLNHSNCCEFVDFVEA